MADPTPTKPPADPGRSRASRLVDWGRGLVVPALAIFSALLIGAVVIVLSDLTFFERLQADPGTALGAAFSEVIGAYGALFTGALGNPGTYATAFASGNVDQITKAFVPISETLLAATPLIFTGLAVALGFQSGLFNIGAEGQLYVGAMFAT